MQQLPLNIRLDDQVSLSSFLVGKNQILIEYLTNLKSQTKNELIYLWGEKGIGKSHLMQSVINRWGDLIPMYLPLSEPGLLPEMLQGLEQFEWIVIDDLDSVAGQRDWEEAIFHLYNKVKDQGSNLIVSANESPTHLSIYLADLKSRLSAMTVFKIQSLSDNDKQALLQQKAAAMGLTLGEEVAQFMLTRSSRDLSCLMSSLDKLDKASLIEQRKITVPFVKQTLHL